MNSYYRCFKFGPFFQKIKFLYRKAQNICLDVIRDVKHMRSNTAQESQDRLHLPLFGSLTLKPSISLKLNSSSGVSLSAIFQLDRRGLGCRTFPRLLFDHLQPAGFLLPCPYISTLSTISSCSDSSYSFLSCNFCQWLIISKITTIIFSIRQTHIRYFVLNGNIIFIKLR